MAEPSQEPATQDTPAEGANSAGAAGPSDEEIATVLRALLAKVRRRPRGQPLLLQPTLPKGYPNYLPHALIS